MAAWTHSRRGRATETTTGAPRRQLGSTLHGVQHTHVCSVLRDCARAALPAAAVEDTQDQSAARELRVLRRLESAVHHPAVGAGGRRAWMLVSVVANLGMLLYFKYGTFLLHNFSALMSGLGIDYRPPEFDIVLPVGISFYTFATMSYTLDVYLRRALPARNFLDYALFVTFFPHLVAGPIMRPTELVPQFEQERRASAQHLRFGLALMTLGLFQKVVLADTFLSNAAERVYDATGAPGALDAWGGTLAFRGQVFCHFPGYSPA